MTLYVQTAICPICESQNISIIKNPSFNAIRSDGIIIKEKFEKYHCHNCFLMWSHNFNSEQETKYLRSDGTSPFELERNNNVAKGLVRIISKEVKAKDNISILEIGAGSFFTSEKLAELFPQSSITAIERSPENKPSQKHNNLTCIETDLVNLDKDGFDVVFSNMVLEHQENPQKFLFDCKSKLNQNGIIITIVPNSDIVSQEVLFQDHYSHFTSNSIVYLANKCDLHLLTLGKASWDHNSLIFILSKEKLYSKKVPIIKSKINCTLFSERKHLIYSWSKYEAISLRARKIFDEQIYLFGAGEFVQLVRCFLPDLYNHAIGLIVSDKNGVRSFDKPIYLLNEAIEANEAKIILSVNQISRQTIKTKLINR